MIEEIGFHSLMAMVEMVCFLTGEAILWLYTLGRRKINRNLANAKSASKDILLSTFSTWLGAAVWLLLIGLFILFLTC